MKQHLLVIDQGTTSTRVIIFDRAGQICGQHQMEFKQYFPQDGWVEHDVEEIWQTTVTCGRQALQKASLSAEQIAAIGITNQRETTVIWERATGKPIYRAIVWQDRRTADYCEQLRGQGHNDLVQEHTGLLLDPYFSGSKINWLLAQEPNVRTQAEQGQLAFGTIDSFLLWRLTNGKVHATDITNASRTLLYNIHNLSWDSQLLNLFQIPEQLLPEVKACSDDFGVCDAQWFGAEIPIAGIAGDQQAALIGQACFNPGMAKSTYGTGCFMIMNTGKQPVPSKHKLLTTIAYQINGETFYGLEGSIFVAGAAVQWVRDGLGLVQHANETGTIAERTGVDHGVYLVPAFTGLGAPYWDANARGAILGLTRDTHADVIVTAALQSVAYQTCDLMNAMAQDGAQYKETLRVDGGMVANDWLVQFLADQLAVAVDRPEIIETTAMGAAYLAGLQIGLYKDLTEIAALWRCQRRFEPAMSTTKREKLYRGWQAAVQRVLT